MGTRCLIGTKANKMRYCHFDGYPSHVIPAIIGYINKHGWEKFEEEINADNYSYLRSISTEKLEKIGKEPELYDWQSAVEEKDTWCEYMYLWKESKLLRFAAHNFVNLVADYNQVLDDNYVEYWL